jgi:DNA-binding response OmpR family regulator
MSETATVLVVEDRTDLANLYAEWLGDRHEVRTATDGRAALAAVDDGVDAALLDRRMPEVSGDEVLATLRDRGHDVRAAMVTAVDPGFDVIDMPFDDYVSKPVTREELVETVDGLLALREYSELQLELSSKRVKHSVLAGEKRRVELEESEEFARLEAEIADLEARLDDIEAEHPEYGPQFERIR